MSLQRINAETLRTNDESDVATDSTINDWPASGAETVHLCRIGEHIDVWPRDLVPIANAALIGQFSITKVRPGGRVE